MNKKKKKIWMNQAKVYFIPPDFHIDTSVSEEHTLT